MYNLSEKAVERMKAELDLLISGKELRFPSEEPHTLAYRIREAIAAAKYHKIKPYADLSYMFTLGPDHVLARPRGQRRLVSGPVEEPRATYPDAESEYQVVAECTKATLTELHFPNFRGDIHAVRHWAKEKRHEVSQDPYLIIRKNFEPIP